MPTVGFIPGGGDAVRCSITNTSDPGSLSVTKVVNADVVGANWAFDVTVSPLDPAVATKTVTKAQPTATWTGLPGGIVYLVKEAAPLDPAYEAGSITCGQVTGSAIDGVSVHVPPGETVACTLTNDRVGSVAPTPGAISVTKVVNADVAGSTWAFDITVSPSGSNTATKSVTKAAPTATWTNLPGGQSYTVVEAPPSDSRYTAGTITCGSVSAAATVGVTIIVPPGQTVDCTVTNDRRRLIPDTGSTSAPLVWFAAAALGLGLVASAAARRSQSLRG